MVRLALASCGLGLAAITCSPSGPTAANTPIVSATPPSTAVLRDAGPDGASGATAGKAAAPIDAALPAPSRARVVGVTGPRVLVRAEGYDDKAKERVAYYAVVDTRTLCIEETHAFKKLEQARLTWASTRAIVPVKLEEPEVAKELERLRKLGDRFGRRVLDGAVFGDDGRVTAVADARGRLFFAHANGFSLLPQFVRPRSPPAPTVPSGASSAPPDGATAEEEEAPLPWRDESLARTPDGRILFGHPDTSGRECASALDPTLGVAKTLVCVRTRKDGGPSFSASPRGTHVSLVERTPSLNTLLVYPVPATNAPNGAPKALARATSKNLFVVPSSFLEVSVDDEGHSAWEASNDFGTFVHRLAKGKQVWDKDNASLVGFVAEGSPDGKVLVVPSRDFPTPGPSETLEKKACGAFRWGAFDDPSPTL